ncbi:hypothetical protein HNQ65_002797 [Prosthecobacter vanneervenii]|uniref:Uncharacterized protein n=2 Tax=Prosthecobacter vanneervenii TaxID=48466 RepID=A0A7W8DKG0_9BACT|nr:hypothetical protein [Prosthecobacter vanneervenii]
MALLPLGMRTQVEDYTGAHRICLTWAFIRISPYLVEAPTEMTRWFTEKAGAGTHSPVWCFEGNSILGFQAYRQGPAPGRHRQRFLFYYMYLSVGKEDKERVIASARRYLDASDPGLCNAIFAEAYNEWGRLIYSP